MTAIGCCSTLDLLVQVCCGEWKGNLRSGTKSDLIGCLESITPTQEHLVAPQPSLGEGQQTTIESHKLLQLALSDVNIISSEMHLQECDVVLQYSILLLQSNEILNKKLLVPGIMKKITNTIHQSDAHLGNLYLFPSICMATRTGKNKKFHANFKKKENNNLQHVTMVYGCGPSDNIYCLLCASLTDIGSDPTLLARSAQVKRYSTEFTGTQVSKHRIDKSAIQAFLKKKETEKKKDVEVAKKRKKELLALRAANPKSNKAAKLMSSRTKSNDFSIIKLSENEEEIKKKVNLEMHRQQTLDKLDRMKCRIALEDEEFKCLAGKKRKRKSHNSDLPVAEKSSDINNSEISKKPRSSEGKIRSSEGKIRSSEGKMRSSEGKNTKFLY
ncbi:hypothetical protein GQR58_021403 [Nymphon striatum]|nr:hypothetical protein GQR58_021403 [Nymphon striatum]